MENGPKVWHAVTRGSLVTAGALGAGFALETLFLDDWPWWAWGILSLACFVALGIFEWYIRRPRPASPDTPEEAEAPSSSPTHFTKAEALAFIERELPMYWPIPNTKWIRKRATRQNALRLLAEIEKEDQFESDSEHGYERLPLYVRIGLEKHVGDDE